MVHVGARRGSPSCHTFSRREEEKVTLLTAVETGDSSMSRCGLMELMFHGDLVLGSGVRIPGPISSLESIPKSTLSGETRRCEGQVDRMEAASR